MRYQLESKSILLVFYTIKVYKQSLSFDKTKIQALENDEKYMAFEIVEFEKLIESQYITRSIQDVLMSYYSGKRIKL
jgi:hypothetical protein